MRADRIDAIIEKYRGQSPPKIEDCAKEVAAELGESPADWYEFVMVALTGTYDLVE